MTRSHGSLHLQVTRRSSTEILDTVGQSLIQPEYMGVRFEHVVYHKRFTWTRAGTDIYLAALLELPRQAASIRPDEPNFSGRVLSILRMKTLPVRSALAPNGTPILGRTDAMSYRAKRANSANVSKLPRTRRLSPIVYPYRSTACTNDETIKVNSKAIARLMPPIQTLYAIGGKLHEKVVRHR